MTRYLLDTNILSNMIKTIDVGGSNAVYTSVIVVSELRFGPAKGKARRLEAQLEAVLKELAVAPFGLPADRVYGELRAELERRGTPIAANDLWIASQALHDASVLVTDNIREFSRVPNLRIENWLRPEIASVSS